MPAVRKTRRRYEEPGHARFLTFSCCQRLPLFHNNAIKDAFVEQLALTRRRMPFKLLAWVVMPEHVHLMVMATLPDCPMPRLLMALKRPFAHRVLSRWRVLRAPILNRILDRNGKPHFWQAGGGYDRNVYSPREFTGKIEYTHANPVRRRLVSCATDWPYSSARWYERDGRYDGPAMDRIHP